jgi:branched-subunit amino acid aminotransferase/4-amino-4-deoxychorismate lyase
LLVLREQAMTEKQIVYLNGEYLAADEAKIPVTDYGLLFGYGLYETTRAYRGKIFRLHEHLHRLESFADRLGIRVDIKELENACYGTLERNPGYENMRIRINLTAGPGSPDPDVSTCKHPTLLIWAIEYHPPSFETYARGYRVIISSIYRNSRSPVPGMKTTNILEAILARKEAQESRADDAFLLNDKELVAEATSSNIFIVQQSGVLTPQLGRGLLPGLTRKLIKGLADESGLGYHEKDITLSELLTADEVFITNSMFEIMPVTAIDNKPVRTGVPGPVTAVLTKAYRRLVKRECT